MCFLPRGIQTKAWGSGKFASDRFLGDAAGRELRKSFAGLWGLGHGEDCFLGVWAGGVGRTASWGLLGGFVGGTAFWAFGGVVGFGLEGSTRCKCQGFGFRFEIS